MECCFRIIEDHPQGVALEDVFGLFFHCSHRDAVDDVTGEQEVDDDDRNNRYRQTQVNCSVFMPVDITA